MLTSIVLGRRDIQINSLDNKLSRSNMFRSNVDTCYKEENRGKGATGVRRRRWTKGVSLRRGH